MIKDKRPYKLPPKTKETVDMEYKDRLLYSLYEEEPNGRLVREEPYENELPEMEKPENKKSGISTTVIKKMIRDMQAEDLKPLELLGTNVVGNLFDRVNFLMQRISETEQAAKERKLLNERFNQEIENDILEMEKVLSTISDREMLREFKLNITLLRMEKRKENTSFWKDTLLLRNQLQELKEQFEIESKISNMFNSLSG